MTSFATAPITKLPPPKGTGGFFPVTADPTPRPLVLGAGQQSQPQGSSSFGPQNNLIGTQINPVASQRGQDAAGATDKAAGNVQNFQFSPFQQVNANTSQSQGIYDQLLKNAQSGGAFGAGGAGAAPSFDINGKLQPLLDKVINSPDRGQIAQDLYGVLEQRAQPGFEQRLRSVGQKASALGRVGAGLTTSELGDVETTHNRDLDLSRRQLAAEGAQGTLSDRLAQLGAARDVYGAVSAAGTGYNNALSAGNQQNFNNLLTLGRDIYGRESDAYGRGVGERNSGLDYEQTRFGNTRNQLNDASVYENDIYGRDRDARDEFRGERNYQYGLERDALGDRERQYGLEQDANNTAFNHALQAAQFGYGMNPAGAVGGAAGQKQGSANSYLDQLGPMFLEWAKKRQGAGGGSSVTRDPSVSTYTE